MISFTEFFDCKGIHVWNILSDRAIDHIFTSTKEIPIAEHVQKEVTGIAVLLPYRLISGTESSTHTKIVTVGSFAAYNYYHFLTRILQELAAKIRAEYGLHRSDIRISVNSKLPEKESAVLANLGWIGKSGLLVNPLYGSAVLIGLMLFPKIDALFQTLVNETDSKNYINNSQCGSCSACIDACPTHALDNGFSKHLCLQYWMSTGGMPEHFKLHRGNHLYGCDVCIKECPYTQQFQDNERLEHQKGQLGDSGQWEGEQEKHREHRGHSSKVFTYLESQLKESEKRPGSYLPLELLAGMSILELKNYFKGTALGFRWIPLNDFKEYMRFLCESERMTT